MPRTLNRVKIKSDLCGDAERLPETSSPRRKPR